MFEYRWDNVKRFQLCFKNCICWRRRNNSCFCRMSFEAMLCRIISGLHRRGSGGDIGMKGSSLFITLLETLSQPSLHGDQDLHLNLDLRLCAARDERFRVEEGSPPHPLILQLTSCRMPRRARSPAALLCIRPAPYL